MKQPIAFRALVGIGGICGILCGMLIAVFSLAGFPQGEPVRHWGIAAMGLLAVVAGFVTFVEKLKGEPL